MARAEGVRVRLRREEDPAEPRGHPERDPPAFARRQGADPGRRQDHRLGFARHPRIPGGAHPQALARRRGRARPRALDRRRDAFRVPEPAQPHEHERAQALRRKGAHAGGAGRDRAHQGDLERSAEAFPFRRLHRRRRDVRACRAALSHLRGGAAARGAQLLRRHARAAGDAGMDRRRRARDRIDPAARHVRVKAYVVGGAVRDELLGLPLKDKDYVVVGATPEEMVRSGFKPVGKDFPVFLHPQTKEEYALARTERKSGRGYKGFTVHAARDLTINAMAKDPDSGALIDPFRGKQDLEKKILRHVSEAFAEDPVRILRVARFAARFGFRVADETMALLKKMVQSGEADYLVPERVWQEFARGLAEPHPEKMFEVLEACGLADRLLDGVKPVLPLLSLSAKANASVPVRFAV